MVAEIISALSSWFFGLLYWIFSKLCWVLDFCQSLFRKLVGLDTIYFNGSSTADDIVELLIRTDVVRNLFISLLVLGIILLFITTFISVWKSEWNFEKDGNSKTKIINAALKALFNFIAVPVVAVFGIVVGNAVLKAIDGATSDGAGTVGMSQTLFVAMSSNAVRNSYDPLVQANLKEYTITINGEEKTAKGVFMLFLGSNSGEISSTDILDAFKSNFKLKNTGEIYQIYDEEGKTDSSSALKILNEKLKNGEEIEFSYDNVELVKIMFDTSEMNFILAFLILIFMIKAMLELTFGLIKRIFNVVILFIISPPIVALSPLNGKPMEEWRKMFISNVIMAYTAVAVYNIFICIYPLFEKINLFPPTTLLNRDLNLIVSLFMITVGLMSINSIISALNEILGYKGGDLVSQSKDGWSNTGKFLGNTISPATAVVGGAVGLAKGGVKFANDTRYMGLGATLKNRAQNLGGKILGSNFAKAAGIKYNADKAKERQKQYDANLKQSKDIFGAVKNSRQDAQYDLDKARDDLGYNSGAQASMSSEQVYRDIKANTDYIGMQEYLDKKKKYDELRHKSGKTAKEKAEVKNLTTYFNNTRAGTGMSTEDYFEQQTVKDTYKQQQSYVDAYDIQGGLSGKDKDKRILAKQETGRANYKKDSKNAGIANSQKEAIKKQQVKNEAENNNP